MNALDIITAINAQLAEYNQQLKMAQEDYTGSNDSRERLHLIIGKVKALNGVLFVISEGKNHQENPQPNDHIKCPCCEIPLEVVKNGTLQVV